jgi:hypothetical protein
LKHWEFKGSSVKISIDHKSPKRLGVYDQGRELCYPEIGHNYFF